MYVDIYTYLLLLTKDSKRTDINEGQQAYRYKRRTATVQTYFPVHTVRKRVTPSRSVQWINKVDSGAFNFDLMRRKLISDVKNGDLRNLTSFMQLNGADALLHCRDEQGHNPVHWACLNGHVHLMKFMIDSGVNVNVASDNTVGTLPIHWACANGHLPIVSLLLSAKCGVSVDVADNNKTTPLLTCSQFGHTLLASYLIGKNADINVTDSYGNTALHWATFRGHDELSCLLMNHGHQVNHRDKFEHTSLHLAVLSSNIWTVHTLLNKVNVRINALNKDGQTALALAVKHNHVSIARLLKHHLGIMTFSENIRWKVLGQPGNSNIGLLFFFVNVVLWAYPNYIYHGLFVTFRTHPFSHFTFFVVNFMMWMSLYFSRSSDPGFIKQNSREYNALIHRVNELDSEIRNLLESVEPDLISKLLPYVKSPLTRLCHTCRCVRPFRAKHCRKCNRCVLNFDHHCPYVGNCIGIANRPWFFVFALTVCTNCFFGLHFTHATVQVFGWTWLYAFGWLQLSVFSLLAFFLMNFMVCYISCNLTTNEVFNYKRYHYLRDPLSGKFRNPYNKGIVRNVYSYFSCGKSDSFVLENNLLANDNRNVTPQNTVYLEESNM